MKFNIIPYSICIQAIQEQHFAPLYAALCSAVKSVEVTEDNGMTALKTLIIKKCQSYFESDKVRQTASAKVLEQIESCKDQVIYYNLYITYRRRARTLKKAKRCLAKIDETFIFYRIFISIIQSANEYV